MIYIAWTNCRLFLKYFLIAMFGDTMKSLSEHINLG